MINNNQYIVGKNCPIAKIINPERKERVTNFANGRTIAYTFPY